MRSSFSTQLRLFLLVSATAFVVGMLLYSQRITEQLLAREKKIADLYAKSYEYISSDRSTNGDLSFLLDEVVQSVDFPVILTDKNNDFVTSRNLPEDSTLTEAERAQFRRKMMDEMDAYAKPIRIAYNDTLVLSYVHYGASDLAVRLRWLPYLELALAGLFVFIAYVGFSYVKRSEQNGIWVGMSKETAHQLGTPLSSLLGWMENLKGHTGLQPELQDIFTEMEQDVQRLQKVAARFSKIGSTPSLREENVNEVIGDVIRYISRRIPKTRHVEVRNETPGVFPVRINRELFEWVIENLMKNALDAMEESPGTISFAVSQATDRTIIDITDTGKGIDPSLHKEVFRPGYSTKKRGWGLGLSLARRIVENYHHGKLTVKQSAPGKGMTFRIKLP